MAHELTRGESADLAEVVPSTTTFDIDLTWAAAPDAQVDVEAFAILCGAEGSMRVDTDLVGPTNEESAMTAVKYKGGDATRAAFRVDVLLLSPDIVRIVFVAGVARADNRDQSLATLNSLRFEIGGTERKGTRSTATIPVTVDDAKSSAVVVAELHRDGPKWTLRALDDTRADLAKALADYRS